LLKGRDDTDRCRKNGGERKAGALSLGRGIGYTEKGDEEEGNA